MTRRLLFTLLFAISVHAQPLSPADRKGIVEMAAYSFDTIYAFPDRGKAIAKALREKNYDAATTARELAAALDADIRALGQNKDLRVEFVERLAGEPVMTRQAWLASRQGGILGFYDPAELARHKATNYGYVHAERLEGNVGYLRVEEFYAFQEIRDATGLAMAFIAGADAVIVDVRDCRGDSSETPGVVQLASYFFDPEPRVLISRYYRSSDQTMPASTIAGLPGKRMPNAPLYVLTGPGTGPACESFAYLLQQFGRAKVVGETTPGAALDGATVPLGRGLRLQLSTSRPIHPKTGRGWEGEGVKPDIPATDALTAAHRAAYPRLADPIEELKKTEREWLDAYEKHDTAAMDRIVAEDFLITHTNGSTQTKADIMKMIARPLDPKRPAAKFSTEDVSVRLFGDTAIISGKVKMVMGERTHVDRYTDTWMRRGGRWVVVGSQLAPIPAPAPKP